VPQYAHKKLGRWTEVAKQLGRPAAGVQQRYRRLISKEEKKSTNKDDHSNKSRDDGAADNTSEDVGSDS
jgi:hypothetical protein